MTIKMPYLHNAWYMAGWGADFPLGGPVALTMLDEPLVLYRQAAGRVVALEDRCCHRLAPLSHGRVEGDDIRCLYHGLKFNAAGKCTEMPGKQVIPSALKVRSFPVIECYSAVFVWMGDPAKRDDSLLPDFIGVEDARYHMLPGRVDYDVWYELVQDNLLDLSHVSWVHRDSFGGGNEEANRAWADAQLRITQLPRGVRVARWTENAATPPPHVQLVGPLCDSLNTFDYLVPGYFLLTSNFYRPGAAQRAGTAEPSEDPVFSSFTAQAVTPLTSKRTSYFFCFGPWAKEPGADALKEPFRDLALKAFEEDRVILTAQQRIIDADPRGR